MSRNGPVKWATILLIITDLSNYNVDIGCETPQYSIPFSHLVQETLKVAIHESRRSLRLLIDRTMDLLCGSLASGIWEDDSDTHQYGMIYTIYIIIHMNSVICYRTISFDFAKQVTQLKASLPKGNLRGGNQPHIYYIYGESILPSLYSSLPSSPWSKTRWRCSDQVYRIEWFPTWSQQLGGPTIPLQGLLIRQEWFPLVC